jgi:hypothetical protein
MASTSVPLISSTSWGFQSVAKTKPPASAYDLNSQASQEDTVVLSEQASGKVTSQSISVVSPDGKKMPEWVIRDKAAAARGEYYTVDEYGVPGFSVLTTLTKADKELVKNVTGWDIDANPEGDGVSEDGKSFAGRLNLDRYTELSSAGKGGTGLGKEVDAVYLQRIINDQLAGQNMVSLDLLFKAKSFVAALENGSSGATVEIP